MSSLVFNCDYFFRAARVRRSRRNTVASVRGILPSKETYSILSSQLIQPLLTTTMPFRANHSSTKPQKHSEKINAEEGEESPQKGRKRNREESPVQPAVAVTPETKQGIIVSYMSGNASPSTPRRGEKKKIRPTEDMEDDADDKEIKYTLDAIRKAEAEAKQTMLEMGTEGGKETDPNNKNGRRPTQSKELLTTHLDPHDEPEIRTRQEKVLPKESQRAENTSNPPPETNSQKEKPHKGTNQGKKIKKEKAHQNEAKEKTKSHYHN